MPSDPKVALRVGMGIRHVSNSLARASSKSLRGKDLQAGCRGSRAHGQAPMPSDPKVALRVGTIRHGVWPEPARRAWQGQGPPGQCHRMPHGQVAPMAWGAYAK